MARGSLTSPTKTKRALAGALRNCRNRVEALPAMTKLPQDAQTQMTFDALASKFSMFSDGKDARPEVQAPATPPEQVQPAQEATATAKASAEIAVPLKPHQLRRARARAAVLDAQTGVSKEPKAFAPNWAVLTSLPARRPEGVSIARPIGDGLIVHFVADPDLGGLPYGQDRLLPIFVTSAYAALGFPEDRVITFRSLAVIRDLFHIAHEGAAIKLRSGLQRWVHTGISLRATTIDARTGKVRVVDRGDKLINASVLYSDEHKPNQYTVFQNAVRLTEWAAEQSKKSLVPVRLALVRALQNNNGACSLALWSGYRANAVAVKRAGELRVPIFGEEGLAAQLGYDGAHFEIRRQIARHLAQVKAEWPQCPHEIRSDEFLVRAYKTPPLELPREFVAGLRRATPATLEALASSPLDAVEKRSRKG